ncbi:hypothetical protein MNBD_BACTEROID02-970, partial [hydrothermal vent metagenome]
MSRDEKTKSSWENIQKEISDKFGGGEIMDV